MRTNGESFCHVWAGSWSYTKHPFRPFVVMLSRLARTHSMGFDYLLDIGPMASGDIEPAAYENIAKLGDWMKINGEAIHGTRALQGKDTASVPATSKGDVHYLYLVPAIKGENEYRVPAISKKNDPPFSCFHHRACRRLSGAIARQRQRANRYQGPRHDHRRDSHRNTRRNRPRGQTFTETLNRTSVKEATAMNRNLSSLSISICTLFMIAARLSASPPQADEAFPPPANAAERTKIELELSKPPTPAQIAWARWEAMDGFRSDAIGDKDRVNLIAANGSRLSRPADARW